ncbi:MAG: urea ABC transporter permease subunit UrtB, partial [Betaproteobacteria bacterium]|nr:urea ABC transporter permease subunit UrtB [Betaproteobacteria bacterium]
MKRWIVKGGWLVVALLCWPVAHALTMEQAKGIAVGDIDARIEALSKAVTQGNDKTTAYLQALTDDAVKISNGQVLVVRDGQGTDPVTGQTMHVPTDVEEVMLNNRLRGEIDTALAALKLFSADVKVRRQAALSLLKEPDPSRAPLLERALKSEKDATVQNLVRQARAAALLNSEVA